MICNQLLLGTGHPTILRNIRNLLAEMEGGGGLGHCIHKDFCLPFIKYSSTEPLYICEKSHLRLFSSIMPLVYIFFCLYDICHPLPVTCEVYFEKQKSWYSFAINFMIWG